MTPGKLEKRIRFEFSDEPTFLEGSCASQKPTPKKSKRQVARRLNITKSEIDLVDVPGSYLGFYLSSRVILKFKLCTLSSIKSKKRPKDGVATFYLKLRERDCNGKIMDGSSEVCLVSSILEVEFLAMDRAVEFAASKNLSNVFFEFDSKGLIDCLTPSLASADWKCLYFLRTSSLRGILLETACFRRFLEKLT
ncbi:uncharacterized protein LOC129287072 isoform X1 [Prosopis cineraria]|uniref:uncharacterized protein LOC129287072 isoform X1 n=1 Tax=Prosopis cineraria TaxID=364024 RepID=UPI00240F8DDA|nr:uncharacterized protein LOC129287072 isoform X1 [Prosopis cineraria]